MSENARELATTAVLLLVTAIFGFVLIPMGIGEGFNSSGAGLSPRFMPEAATIGIGASLLFGLIRRYFAVKPDENSNGAVDGEGAHPLRAVTALSICLFFSFVGFNLAGFYIGGVAMASALILLLGEREILKVFVFPVLVLLVIYVVFEFGFQIRLPKSGLIPSIPV